MAARNAIIGEYEGEGIALFVTDDRAEAHRVRENAIQVDRVVYDECETDPMRMALTTVCNEAGVYERIIGGCDSLRRRVARAGGDGHRRPRAVGHPQDDGERATWLHRRATSVLPRHPVSCHGVHPASSSCTWGEDSRSIGTLASGLPSVGFSARA